MVHRKSTDLLFGPYALPRGFAIGDDIPCRSRDRKIEIRSITDAPVAWFNARRNGHYVLILCGDLVRAVKMESAAAVAHNWGVTNDTVSTWRRKLGVGKMTPGTKQVWQDLMPTRLTADAIERGQRKSRRKTSRAKMAAAKSGIPMYANTRKALLRAVKKAKSQEPRKPSHAPIVRVEPFRLVADGPGRRPKTRSSARHQTRPLGKNCDGLLRQ